MSDFLYFLRYWIIYVHVYCSCLFARLWLVNFENNLIISSSRFATWLKNQDKNLNILPTKRAFIMKGKTIFIILKGLSLKQIKKRFWKMKESPWFLGLWLILIIMKKTIFARFWRYSLFSQICLIISYK